MIPKSQTRWLVPGFIILAIMGLFLVGDRLGSPLKAQAELQAGAESGVLVVPVQITRDSYGLAMVDTVNQTLWLYELNSHGPAYSRLRLMAARSWRYDRLLQQYNTDEPRPEQVKMLLENLGRPQKEQNKEKQSGSDINILEIAEPNDSNTTGL